MLVNVAANHLVSGKPARRFGNGHPNIVPYRTFEAKDGSIAIAVGNDTQFAKFAACLNKEEWATDTRFTKNADRVINRQLIDQEIQNVALTHDLYFQGKGPFLDPLKHQLLASHLQTQRFMLGLPFMMSTMQNLIWIEIWYVLVLINEEFENYTFMLAIFL